jgi:prevent-host-death family protein
MAKGSSGVTRITLKQVEEGILVSTPQAYAEISLSKLRSKLSETLNRVQYGKQCVLVTNYGKKVAQILPMPED